jgi:dienelactone hydrolase
MIDNIVSQPGGDRREGSLDRRTFLSALGLAGTVLAAQGDAAAQSGGIPCLQDGSCTGSDSGSVYAEILTLADQCRYPLSWLEKAYPNAESYKTTVRERVLDLLHYSPPAVPPAPEILARWETPDCTQERVLFSTTPWFRVPAYVLIPKGRKGPRPAIVDLHSHGGMFLYGKEKVMPVPEGEHSAITRYRQENYDGRSTSLELCRRGYVVVSIDCFYFGERRTVFKADISGRGADRAKYSLEDVAHLNRKLSQGESTMARSLQWAGTTWQGIAHWDDMRTVDYLATRPEVDPKRIGCLGISMGGYRTDFLAGLDERIRAAVSVGWMSTLRPMIKAHVNTHSFIHFLPGLTRYVDLPDVIACMAPKPLMVQQCTRDALYPIDGMRESVRKIAAVYEKAGAASRFQGRFYDRPHVFSASMQDEAFAWLDHWLKP